MPSPARRVIIMLCAALALAPGLAPAQDRAEAEARLERIQAELADRAAEQRALAEKAEAAGEKAEALTRRIIASAADIQALEERIADADRKIEELVRLRREERSALAARRSCA